MLLRWRILYWYRQGILSRGVIVGRGRLSKKNAMSWWKQKVSRWKKMDYGNAVGPDTFKELREAAVTFFKFDLAYIAALGTIATILHLEPESIATALAKSSWVVHMILGLLVFDSLIIWQLGNLWLTAKSGRPNRMPQIVQRGVLRLAPAQPVVHAIVLFMVVGVAVAIATGLDDYREGRRTMAAIQDELDAFISQTGKVPATVEDLAAQRPKAAEALRNLRGNMKLTLTPRGEKGYVLQLGWEGTAEGLKLPESVKLREVIPEMEGQGKGHH
jgi:hypothetical protein